MAIQSLSTDASGRLARVPQRLIKAIANGVIVRMCNQYSYSKTSGGLILGTGDADDISDRKYKIGEIISKGETVPDSVQVGDIVVYLHQAAYRLPNGHGDDARLFKIPYNDMAIMGVLPNLDPTRRNPSWANHRHIADIEAEAEQWRSGDESIPTDRPADRLRLMSYNIRHGQGPDGRTDLVRTAQAIREEDPDVVALQEVDRGCGRTQNVDQVAVLADMLGMPHHHFTKAFDYDGGEYGIAILSKRPITAAGSVSLPHDPSDSKAEPRVAQSVTIDALEGQITIVNTHLEVASERARIMQAAEVSTLATGLDAVLLGDFNAIRSSVVLTSLSAAGWEIPAKSGVPGTVPAASPEREIDFALLRPAGAMRVIRSLAPRRAEPASDHLPVVIEVQRAAKPVE